MSDNRGYNIQVNLSNLATSLTEENNKIRQVIRIDRLEKYMGKLNRQFFSRIG